MTLLFKNDFVTICSFIYVNYRYNQDLPVSQSVALLVLEILLTQKGKVEEKKTEIKSTWFFYCFIHDLIYQMLLEYNFLQGNNVSIKWKDTFQVLGLVSSS